MKINASRNLLLFQETLRVQTADYDSCEIEVKQATTYGDIKKKVISEIANDYKVRLEETEYVIFCSLKGLMNDDQKYVSGSHQGSALALVKNNRQEPKYILMTFSSGIGYQRRVVFAKNCKSSFGELSYIDQVEGAVIFESSDNTISWKAMPRYELGSAPIVLDLKRQRHLLPRAHLGIFTDGMKTKKKLEKLSSSMNKRKLTSVASRKEIKFDEPGELGFLHQRKRVVLLFPKGLAQHKGVKVGWQIVNINNKENPSDSDISNIVKKYKNNQGTPPTRIIFSKHANDYVHKFSGYLTKYKDINKDGQRLLFVLKKESLGYMDDDSKESKESIFLKDMKSITPENSNTKNIFSITTHKGQYFLGASSSDERQKWIQILNAAIRQWAIKDIYKNHRDTIMKMRRSTHKAVKTVIPRIAHDLNKSEELIKAYIEWKTKRDNFEDLDAEDKMLVVRLFVKHIPVEVIAKKLNQDVEVIQAFINHKKKIQPSTVKTEPKKKGWEPKKKQRHLDLTSRFTDDSGKCSVRKTVVRIQSGEDSPPEFYVKSSTHAQYFKITKEVQAKHSVEDFVPIECDDGTWTLAQISEVDEENQLYHLKSKKVTKIITFANSKLYPRIYNPYTENTFSRPFAPNPKSKSPKTVTFINNSGSKIDIKISQLTNKTGDLPSTSIGDGEAIKYLTNRQSINIHICKSKANFSLGADQAWIYSNGKVTRFLDSAEHIIFKEYMAASAKISDISEKLSKPSNLIKAVINARKVEEAKK